MIGYVLAFVSSLFFAIYIVPRKLSKINPVYFSFFMSLGFLASSLLLYLMQPLLKFQEQISLNLLWALMAGLIWSVSFVCYVSSIDIIGLSRSNQWKNLQGPIGILLGLVVLHEYSNTNPVFVVLAGVVIFVSAVFLSKTTSDDNNRTVSKGIGLALLSGIGFGVVSLINKYLSVHVGVFSQQVVWSFGIAISLLLYIFIKDGSINVLRKVSKNDFWLGTLAGLLYTGASFFSLEAYRFIPVSVGITILQLSSLWVVAIGIFVFKEIDLKKYFRNVLLGILFAIVSIVLLFFT